MSLPASKFIEWIKHTETPLLGEGSLTRKKGVCLGSRRFHSSFACLRMECLLSCDSCIV